MYKQILYILSLMGLFSFAACTNEESPLFSEGTGEIRFSVVDTTEIEIATRASYYFDVNKFNVSLNRGSEPIFSDKKYGDLVGKTFTYSAGPDYVLTAESCTEAEAESANQGWGQARASGKESFAIVKDESKTVTVNPLNSMRLMQLAVLLRSIRVTILLRRLISMSVNREERWPIRSAYIPSRILIRGH